MTQTHAIGRDMQEEFLGAVRKSQDFVVEAIGTWADAVQAVTPKLPAMRVPLARKLPQLEEVVDTAFEFAEKLLVGQRKFAEEVIKAIAPVMPGTAKEEPSGAKRSGTPPAAPAPNGGGKAARPSAK